MQLGGESPRFVIFEDYRLQWAEEARRLRDSMSGPCAEIVRQRLLNYGLLADEILPQDTGEARVGKDKLPQSHALVRSLEWLYNAFRTLFYEEELGSRYDVGGLRVSLQLFLPTGSFRGIIVGTLKER